MTARFHAAAALLAMACIATLWVGTVIAELFLPVEGVVRVKEMIVQGLALLIPALAATGASGSLLAARHPTGIARRKLLRMKWVAANGLLILVPAAFFLRHKAGLGELDAQFWMVQVAELLAGAANLSLMALNARDGVRLAGWSATRRRTASQGPV